MNPELQKQVFDHIDALAAKLGVAAQFLWGVLLKQAYVEGWTYIVFYVLWAGAFCGWIAVFRKFRRLEEESRYNNGEDAWAFVSAIYGIVMAIALVVALCTVPTTLTDFINPSYSALLQLKAVFN